MTDRILLWIVISLSAIVGVEFLIPGPTRKSQISGIHSEAGWMVRRRSVKNYQETAAYFEGYRLRLDEEDLAYFKEGDSIEYNLTLLTSNIRTIRNLRNGHQVYPHSYLILLLLTGMSFVGQVLKVMIRWNKTTGGVVRVLILSFILAAGLVMFFEQF